MGSRGDRSPGDPLCGARQDVDRHVGPSRDGTDEGQTDAQGAEVPGNHRHGDTREAEDDEETGGGPQRSSARPATTMAGTAPAPMNSRAMPSCPSVTFAWVRTAGMDAPHTPQNLPNTRKAT